MYYNRKKVNIGSGPWIIKWLFCRWLNPECTNDDVNEGDDEDDDGSDVVEDVGSSVIPLVVDVHSTDSKEEYSHQSLNKTDNAHPANFAFYLNNSNSSYLEHQTGNNQNHHCRVVFNLTLSLGYKSNLLKDTFVGLYCGVKRFLLFKYQVIDSVRKLWKRTRTCL